MDIRGCTKDEISETANCLLPRLLHPGTPANQAELPTFCFLFAPVKLVSKR